MKLNLRDLLFDETTQTRTENLAKAYTTTKSYVLDLFAIGGAARTLPHEDVYQKISQALAEDLELGVRALLFLSDIRGGQGERRLFKIGIQVLIDTQPQVLVERVLGLVPFYGRWDYLLDFINDPKYNKTVLDIIKTEVDKNETSLIYKWLPSIQRKPQLAIKIAKHLGLTNKEYRKLLSKQRGLLRVVEKDMSAKNWMGIDYSRLPSKASMIYREAFLRHDRDRYEAFINKVIKGEFKINAKTLYPHEIVHKVWNNPDATMEALWKNLPDYVKDKTKNTLAMIDVSGSMDWHTISPQSRVRPIHVAIAMGMYLGERLQGEFKDTFLTFSGRPELVKIVGDSLYQRVRNISGANWGGNTNIISAFETILDVATRNKLTQAQIPNTIVIFSDMEFDSSADFNMTPFNDIKEKYNSLGYELPQIVFWNLEARNVHFPVRQNEKGVILVSGYSPTTLQYILSGELKTPYELMLEVLNQERYNIFD